MTIPIKLSVIMPVYNEVENLSKILEKVQKVNIEKEIIIVDDGSSDGTRDILEKIEQDNVKIYYHAKNMGKGYAVRTGLQHISGDIVIIQDADLEYDPNDYHKLLQPLIEGKISVVYGSRPLGKNPISYSRYYWGSWFLNFVGNLLYGTRLTDLYTCYKVFRSEVIKPLNLQCKGFEFCPEVTAKISKNGYNILEVPISYKPRAFSQGKKIRWYDGFIGLWTLIRYRLWD